MTHIQPHLIHRSARLRASVLGANDGIVSTACLIVGVASATSSLTTITISAMAGLISGALSMAIGEYLSVRSQAELEKAELTLEADSINKFREAETAELALIYMKRGVDSKTAELVAEQLMAHDAIGAHARDDIGIDINEQANPLQAAIYSCLSFTLGAIFPVAMIWFAEPEQIITAVFIVSLVALLLLGFVSASLSRTPVLKSGLRVMIYAGFAMFLTAAIGEYIGTVL